MLYAVPPILILAGWLRGSRPEERPVIAGLAGVAGVGSLAAVWLAQSTPSELVEGCAYALVVIATASAAMLVRRRPGRVEGDGRDEGPPHDPGAGPDRDPDEPLPQWDEFERRFWEEVERHERERAPA